MSPYLHQTKMSRLGAALRLVLLLAIVVLALTGTRERLRESPQHGRARWIAELPIVMLALGIVLGGMLTAADERGKS